jgi:hypothetical protein
MSFQEDKHPEVSLPLLSTAGRQKTEGAQWQTAPKCGLGCLFWVLTTFASPSGRSPNWMRSSCTAWRTCVAAPSMSVVSGEGTSPQPFVGSARVGEA